MLFGRIFGCFLAVLGYFQDSHHYLLIFVHDVSFFYLIRQSVPPGFLAKGWGVPPQFWPVSTYGQGPDLPNAAYLQLHAEPVRNRRFAPIVLLRRDGASKRCKEIWYLLFTQLCQTFLLVDQSLYTRLIYTIIKTLPKSRTSRAIDLEAHA
jgi:hypothetical protein